MVKEGRAHLCCKYVRVLDTSVRQLPKLMHKLSTRVEIDSFWKQGFCSSGVVQA